MKKWILLTLLFPALVWADCQNPIGRVYQGDGLTITFREAYPPEEGMCIVEQGDFRTWFPFTWNQAACRATLMDTDPPVYLDFQDGWFEVSATPRFEWITSTD